MKKVVLLILIFLPCLALAEENFSLTISDQFVSSLSNSNSRLARAANATSIALPTRKGSKTITLSQVEIRSPRYESYLSTSAGRIRDNTTVTLYKGVAAQSSKDFEFYRFALINDGKSKPYLDGYFFSEGSYYSLKRENTGAEYLVSSMTEDDFAKLAKACGLPHQHGTSRLSKASGQANITALKTLEVATDADYEYFTQEGGTSNANATILSILNSVDAIYRAQLNVTISVVLQNVWTTSSDPYSYTVPIHLLNEFMVYWGDNFSNRNYDVAHLFTGKDLDGGVVGIAFLGAICGSFKYGLSQKYSSAYDVTITAHEIGHNLGADHDSCNGSSFVMCPTLVPYANTFSPNSVNSIAQTANNATCLSNGGGNPTPTPTPTPPPGNSPPILGGIGPRTIREGDTLSINLTASDANGDSLSYSVTSTPYGSLSGNSYVFSAPVGAVPSGSTTLRYNLTFTVSDGLATDSETILLTVTKAPNPNQPPIFTDPVDPEIFEGNVLKLRLNAVDPENGPVNFTFNSDLPPGASFNKSEGLLSWRPLGDQSGTYNFDITVADQAGLTTSGNFTVYVYNREGVPEMPSKHRQGDFDGDGLAELAAFRNFSGEWFTRNFHGSAFRTTQFGLNGDLPVPGDYNGDRITDFAVFRPSTSTWYILTSGDGLFLSIPFGSSGDLPVGGSDFDGDGRDDIGIFRPAIGSFVYRGVFGTERSVNIGTRGDIPVPCDYNGDGRDDITVFRPSRGLWISNVDGAISQLQFGVNNDVPLSGDINGDGRCERFLFRDGQWIGEAGVYDYFGTGADTPHMADYNGDGTDNFGLWRSRQQTWHSNISSWFPKPFALFRDVSALEATKVYAMKNSSRNGVVGRGAGIERAFVYLQKTKTLYSIYSGGSSSRKLTAAKGSYIFRGDYDGDNQLDLVYYYQGVWTVSFANGTSRTFNWGYATDVPVVGDFDGDAKADAAVYRNGEWHTISSLTGRLVIYNVGSAADVPIPADYNGDGRTDPAVVNKTTMVWQSVDARSNTPLTFTQWGLPGDVPVVADFDLDGRADLVAYRPSNGVWHIRMSGGNEVYIAWGLPGDLPVAGSFFSSAAVDLAVFRPSTGQLIPRSLVGQATVLSLGAAKNGQLVDTSLQQTIQ